MSEANLKLLNAPFHPYIRLFLFHPPRSYDLTTFIQVWSNSTRTTVETIIPKTSCTWNMCAASPPSSLPRYIRYTRARARACTHTRVETVRIHHIWDLCTCVVLAGKAKRSRAEVRGEGKSGEIRRWMCIRQPADNKAPNTSRQPAVEIYVHVSTLVYTYAHPCNICTHGSR